MNDTLAQSLAAIKSLLASFQTLQKGAKLSPADAQAAVVHFVEVLPEKMEGIAFASVGRVHQPRSVEFGKQKAESYTDIGTRLAVYCYQVIVDTIDDPDKDFCDMPGFLEEPEQVAAHWAAIVKNLTKAGMIKLDLDRLLVQIEQEHKQAKPTKPRLPFVYQTKKKAFPAEVLRVGKKSKPAGTTDAITFSPGEPDKPYVTKIGGVPFRAADVPWPMTAAGKPMTFVAQFCFADSKDLVGELPGDVLLIFGEDEQFCYPSSCGDEGRISFEWYPLASFPLIKPKDVPVTPWKITPCFGTVKRQTEKKKAIESAKIGGQPVCIQQAWPADRFICALQGQPYSLGPGALQIADLGVMNFYLHGDGQVSWMMDSY